MIELRLLSLSAIIIVGGCVVPPATVTQPETDAPVSSTSEAVLEDTADTGEEPSLSPEAIQTAIDNHVEESIRLLQHGQVDGASIQLAAALRLDPDNAIANSLLQQIDTDPVEALGEKHFTYTVRRNDSLSKLAKRFLKDPYQFFILARYNSIEDPDRLQAGQIIKIPGERPKKAIPTVKKPPARPAKTAAAQTPQRTTEDPHQKKLQHVNELLANQDYPGAIAALKDIIAQSGKRNTGVEQVFVHTHLNYAAILESSGDMDESRDILQSALEIVPDNTALSLKLEEMENNIAADSFFNEGLQKLEEQQLESAYRYFADAIELNPAHKDAAMQAEQTKASLIARHDKTAMAAYRRQDLDTAIAQWQKVLDLDPENERAKHYRTLSMELQRRIQEF